MKITFVGHGYVGLVTAGIFADLGNAVNVIGHTKEKIDKLNKGIIPIFEPGLSEIIERNIKAGRLFFTLDYKPYIADSKIVFIAVGTPPKKNGDADLSTVYKVAEDIGKNIKNYTVVATKSTVPAGTNKKVKEIINKVKSSNVQFDVASVPEFLREGSAIQDTLHPDRIVIGTENKKAQDVLVELHKSIESDVILTNLETAEMIKYASNAFLATKISFANAIASLSEITGADGIKVLEGMGLDRRVGREFLQPGPGYGGSCFPKDVKALISIARNSGYKFSLLDEVENINAQARLNIVIKSEKLLGKLKGKNIGILGLAFKANTDDMRDAPSIDIINYLVEQGAHVKAYDPQAAVNAKKLISGAVFCSNIVDTVRDTDLLIVLTDWNEFKEIDLGLIRKTMKSPKIIDARNMYNPEKLKKMGFSYLGTGR